MRGSVRGAVGGVLALGLAASIGLGSAAIGQTAGYEVTNLVADRPGEALVVDENLVNAWGLTAGPSTFWWVANNGTDTTTLYNGAGSPQSLVVSVEGAPTGAVFNGGSGFVVTDGTTSAPALFLFATESGTIRGWSPTVGTTMPPSMQTEKAVDRSGRGAIYKGLAIASTTDGDRLYATDFHNGRVDVFDGTFQRIRMPGAFRDPEIPSHFAPFGIQKIGDEIFVTYAKQDADAEDDVAGRHLGFVDRFDTAGGLLGRFVSRGPLNAPWGLAMAPAEFGPFGGDLLVGNFGNGRINAFDPSASGKLAFEGRLRDSNGDAIAIDGLWAIAFGNGGNAGPTDTLFFTAGPEDESHGLFGMIEATA